MKKQHISLVLSLVLAMTIPYFVQAQKWDVNGNIINPNDFLGTLNNRDLQFKTNGVNFERMIIKRNTGFVGIGTNFTNPNNLLDIDGGDIDVNTPANGYMIGDNYVLWNKSMVNDIFVGVGAGTNTPAGALNNTFVGFRSGAQGNNASFSENTFVGSKAGVQAQGHLNVYIGYNAGWSGGGSGNNTFVGAEAGYLDLAGDENVFVGWKSGYNCVVGYHNAFLGNISGFNNSSGSNNTFIGISSGLQNTIGSGNTSLGAGAGPSVGNLNNAAAIGAGAIVTQSDQLILGNSTQNVGIGLSSDPLGPQNNLEINTTATSPVPGASGLRLRDMTSISTVIPNPGPGVLAVDINGDVVYVQSPVSTSLSNAHNGTSLSTITTGFVAFGQDVGQSGNPGQLLNDREIPTSNFNLLFTDPLVKTAGKNLISFGNVYSGSPLGAPKVYSENRSEPVSIKGITDAGVTTGFQPGVGNIGVMGEVVNSNWAYATGVYGLSKPNPSPNGNWSFGVFGETKLTPNDMAMAIGVAGNSDSPGNAVINCGGWFTASNATGITPIGTSGINYGVYGWVPPSQNGYAVFSDGNLFVNGNGFATGTFTWSDKRLKKDIGNISNAMDIINQLKPATYYYDTDNKYNLRFSDTKQYGLVAQDVEEVLPEIVKEVTKPAEYSKDGKETYPSATLKTINYTELIPILIQAMQEQQKSISDLENKVNELTGVLEAAGLLSNTGGSGNSQTDVNVSLANKEVVVLNQNVPNPFAQQTVITFTLPDNTGNAQLVFFNNMGQMIKTVDITTRGHGQITVFGDDLSSGTYSYTLVVDGKIIDTRKMIKTE